MSPHSELMALAADMLVQSRRIVVSTGAGISKESGIPTFRDAPSALWAKYDPEKLATRDGFRQDPALVWRWYEERRQMIADAKPNAGHRAIAELEGLVPSVIVITQNIDNLHRAAGSTDPVELHGNIFRYKCFDNDHECDTLPDVPDVPPRCRCGSMLRPAVVWFGELLPASALDRAFQALATCQAIVVVGTSGLVYPAAGFPEVARQSGASVIEVNPERSAITDMADVFLQGPAGTVLPQLIAEVRARLERGTRS